MHQRLGQEFFERGLYLEVYETIEYNLRSNDPSLRRSAQVVIDKVPDFWDRLFADIATSIIRLSSPSDANTLYDRIRRLYEVPSIDPQYNRA
jgi:hypothetical protein